MRLQLFCSVAVLCLTGTTAVHAANTNAANSRAPTNGAAGSAASAQAATNYPSDYRGWRDVQKRFIVARVVGFEGDSVKLARKDGVVACVPLMQLSEWDRRYLGRIRRAAEAATYAGPQCPRTSLPGTFSLRPEYERLGVDVRDQGRRGSCTIFGVLSPLEFQLARNGQADRLSERFAMWAANLYRGRTGGNESYSVGDVVEALRIYGCTTESAHSGKYKDHGAVAAPSKDVQQDAGMRKDLHVQWLYTNEGVPNALPTEDVLTSICAILLTTNPVTLSLAWPNKVRLSSTKIIQDGAAWNHGHVVVAVGFRMTGSRYGGGLFELRNSWGERWGDDGYAFIAFDTLKRNLHTAVAVAPGVSPGPE